MTVPVLPSVTAADRRQRLIARHGLHGHVADPREAIRAVIAVHATDPATPHLGLWSRMRECADSTIDGAGFAPLVVTIVDDRTAWRLHAMRRTLFVVDLTDAEPVHTGASAPVAASERRRLLRSLEANDVALDLDDVAHRTVDTLVEHGPMSSTDLSQHVAELSTRITVGSGRWAAEQSLASRALLLFAMEGIVTRAETVGSWRSGQYRWAASQSWFSGQLPPTADQPVDDAGAQQARAQLVGRYLESCGPVTVADVAWWTGWSPTKAQQALDDAGAMTVKLEESAELGYIAADDPIVNGNDCAPPAEALSSDAAVCLLPALDSTPMSYRDRDWYLPDDFPPLFDRNGNIGPTVWANGQIVGGWGQLDSGQVTVGLLQPVTGAIRAAIDRHAGWLTTALNGQRVIPRFRTPLERSLSSDC